MARVLHTFEPPDGGVAEHVVLVATQLAALGHEVVVAGPRETAAYDALEGAGVRCERLAIGRGYGRPADEVRAVGALTALLRDERFDLAHCHSAKAGVLGRIAAGRAGVPA